jgi:hypothetical protein
MRSRIDVFVHPHDWEATNAISKNNNKTRYHGIRQENNPSPIKIYCN